MIYSICRQTTENFVLSSKGKKIVFWGAVKKNVEKAMKDYGKPECIIDSDPEKWGTRCETIKVYPPEHLYSIDPSTHTILVTAGTDSVYSIAKMIRIVDEFDVFFYGVLSNKFFGFFSNQLFDNIDKIKNVESHLNDDISRKVFRECVCRRIMGGTGTYRELKVENNSQYIFWPMLNRIEDNGEVVIDCGGYTGDSVEKFVDVLGNDLKKVYSFECFEENINEIQNTGKRLKSEGWNGELIIAPYAVSDRCGFAEFNDIGISEGGYLPENRTTVKYNEKLAPVSVHKVEMVSIDDYIDETEKVTIIKMDIEGAEYAALKGAEKTIKKHSPRLAISIYHNPEDYWRIFELIYEYSKDYKFAVRHHQNNHLDTVLYAWKEI